ALRNPVAESGERLACAAGLPPAALGADRGEEGDLAGGVGRGGAALGDAGGGAGGGCLQVEVAEDGGLADGGGCGGGHALAEGVGHLFDDLGADVGGDAHAAPRCPGTRRTANRPNRRATRSSSPSSRRTSGIGTSTCAVSIPAVSSTCSTAASNSPSRAGRVTTSASSSSAAITSSRAAGSDAQCCTSCTRVSVRIWSTRSTPASSSTRTSKDSWGFFDVGFIGGPP